MRYCVHRAHYTQCADCLTNPELNAFSIISLISLIFLARCPSFRLDTLVFGITFRVASCLFLNPSISSISLISLLLCIFTSTRGLTETYLVGVRSGASMFLNRMVRNIRYPLNQTLLSSLSIYFESEPLSLSS